jgi:hypothetical protein
MDLKDVLVALVFFIGFAFRILIIADKDVKQTLFPTKRQWFKVFWPNTLVRGGILMALWVFYADSPNVVVNLLSHFGINFNMALPITKVTSLMAGYTGDAALDVIGQKIPFIGRIIPEGYIPHEVKQQLKDQQNATNNPPTPGSGV